MLKHATKLFCAVTITMVTQRNRNQILSHSNTTLSIWRPLTFHLLLTSFDGFSLGAANCRLLFSHSIIQHKHYFHFLL